jgi:hypothetical protein
MRTFVAIVLVAGCAAASPPTANVAAPRPEPGNETISAGLDTSWPLDPYLSQLAADLRQNLRIPPTVDDEVQPVACVHMTAAGLVAEAKLEKSSGDAALDESVEHALDALKFDRNEHAIPVPSHLLAATTRWMCFRVALD